MSIKDKYAIIRVGSEWLKDIIENNHYLHRISQVSYGFGLFEKKTKELVGGITYGNPGSPTVAPSICGEEESDEVIELKRLWTEDSTPRNTESYLIGNSLKEVDKDIIISYADSERGHIGYVYQATNWLYTGMTSGGSMWVVEGRNMHPRSLHNVYDSIEDAKKDLGDKLTKIKVTKKHRYIYFNCNKRRKKELREKLKYPILPYPKG